LTNANNSSDVIFGGSGDDTLYGNSGNDTLYGDDDVEPVAVAQTATTANGIVYNGSEYVLTNSRASWTSAQAQAEALGGNLVTINDAAEANWLQSQFDNGQSFWIGINDRAQEGRFEWASGEAVDYTDWRNGGPDNYGNQDYGVIEWEGTGGSQWQDHYEDGGWEYNNGWQWQYGYQGIIEIKLPEVLEDDGTGGNDIIEGGAGNDTVKGGGGADVLDGSDAIANGINEQDILGGGLGADTFVLGTTAQSYYIGGGDNDYARILDFNARNDVIQLHGSANNYDQWQQDNALRLYTNGDLVAVLEGVNSLDLNSTSVSFV
ncbi:MAG: lectin-like protein, partial [Cyanobacteria bacterium P01_D01_bin.36]